MVLGYSRSPPSSHPTPLAACPNPIASPRPGTSARPGLPQGPLKPLVTTSLMESRRRREGEVGILPHIWVTFLLPCPTPSKSVISLFKDFSQTSGLSHTSGSLGVCLAPGLIPQSLKPSSTTGPSVFIPPPSPFLSSFLPREPGVSLALLPLSLSLYNTLLEWDSAHSTSP